jgi:hypothetical protein
MVSADRTFEKKRVRPYAQSSAWAQPFSATSRNDERNGARNPAQRSRITVSRSASSRSASVCSRRKATAPASAPAEVLTYPNRIIAGGTPLWTCAARSAAKVAASTAAHERAGVRRRPASRMAFGGQNAGTDEGSRVSATPTLAPT